MHLENTLSANKAADSTLELTALKRRKRSAASRAFRKAVQRIK